MESDGELAKVEMSAVETTSHFPHLAPSSSAAAPADNGCKGYVLIDQAQCPWSLNWSTDHECLKMEAKARLSRMFPAIGKTAARCKGPPTVVTDEPRQVAEIVIRINLMAITTVSSEAYYTYTPCACCEVQALFVKPR
jgi:hypothetical protein